MKLFVALAFALIIPGDLFAQGQVVKKCEAEGRFSSGAWKTFSPLGKDFQIELPAEPCYTEFKSGTYPNELIESVDLYRANEGPPKYRGYIFHVIVQARFGRFGDDDDLMGPLGWMFGSPKILSEHMFTQGNLRIKDTSYDSGFDTTSMRRTRIIVADRRRVYMLTYCTDTIQDLTSENATRFLESFKIIK